MLLVRLGLRQQLQRHQSYHKKNNHHDARRGKKGNGNFRLWRLTNHIRARTPFSGSRRSSSSSGSSSSNSSSRRRSFYSTDNSSSSSSNGSRDSIAIASIGSHDCTLHCYGDTSSTSSSSSRTSRSSIFFFQSWSYGNRCYYYCCYRRCCISAPTWRSPGHSCLSLPLLFLLLLLPPAPPAPPAPPPPTGATYLWNRNRPLYPLPLLAPKLSFSQTPSLHHLPKKRPFSALAALLLSSNNTAIQSVPGFPTRLDLSLSSSLSAMVTSVNRTALHPGGVVPSREHTEIEEELHDKANIDYDRVAIVPNPSVAALYEDALVYETGTAITSSGALTAYSGAKTGRSPQDKRIVQEPTSENEIWWGPVNKPMSPDVWRINRERAIDYLNTRSRIYVVDGFAGWDERYRINVRVVCARAYHALFMRNMLIRPKPEELEHFVPDYVIYNAGSFPANRYTVGMTSSTSVAINFAEKEMVILGTEYAGEMKKGVFTILFYEMPVKHDVLTLHSSCNEGKDGDVTVFFGLSGTGKTTLSADPNRALIGDDEHCWTDTGVFNIEGGCYAKCINLSAAKEPEIFSAIRFGSVLENVVFDPETRIVDYDDSTLTENTRASYPIEYINNAKIPCVTSTHPKNIILLCCDARGVLPVISKLNPEQVMYHFISGYTSKMAGTEDGITEPIATFSACFAQPFLALSPMRYARMLADKIMRHKADAWLLNTGWVGGSVVKGGRRCPLKYTRAILDAIHNGELAEAEYETYEVFNLQIPTHVTGVPPEILNPTKCWKATAAEFDTEVSGLAQLFVKNFNKYADEATSEVKAAGPVIQ